MTASPCDEQMVVMRGYGVDFARLVFEFTRNVSQDNWRCVPLAHEVAHRSKARWRCELFTQATIDATEIAISVA
eukprot:5351955-Amphidinium_carterae.2